MRKLLVVALILSFATTAYAIGYQKEGEDIGQITTINVQGASSFDGSVVTLITNGHKDGVTQNVSTESSLTSAALAYGVVDMRIGSAKTIGLSNGVKGQMLTIVCTVRDGKNVIISKTGMVGGCTTTGWTTITIDTQLDSITLLYVDDTSGWIIFANSGCTIA